jgi:transcription elongation factor Elf1
VTTLEERVAQLQAKQRRQREWWAEQGWCEDCGSDAAVEGAVDVVSDIYRLSCVKCRAKKAGF